MFASLPFSPSRAIVRTMAAADASASVSGDSQGNPRSVVRVGGLAKDLGRGCISTKELRIKQDLEYIMQELEGNSRDIVPDICTLMRSGSFDKAIRKAAGLSDSKGQELAKSADCLRNLRDAFLSRALKRFEPNKFGEDPSSDITRADMLQRVAFALNAKMGTKLPKEFKCLRFEEPLLHYLVGVYEACGKRLQGYNNESPAGSWGMYQIVDGHIQFRLCKNTDGETEVAKIEIPKGLAEASDLTIEDNFCLDATLVSKEEDTRTQLRGRFVKAGIELCEEAVGVFELPSARVPTSVKNFEAIMTGTPVAGSQESSAASGSTATTASTGSTPVRSGEGVASAKRPRRGPKRG